MRLWKVNAPLADWHSWRQADTASVSRHFLEDGFNVLVPRFDDLSNIPSRIDNPNGYRFVEFPLYNVLHAFLFRIENTLGVTFVNFEGAGRLVSIVFWLLGAFWLYKIIWLISGRIAAIAALFFFVFLPYGIYYSRTILPDPVMISLALGSVYYLLTYDFSFEGRLRFCLCTLLSAASILVKPYAVFIIVPSVFAIAAFAKAPLSKKALMAFCLLLLSFLPFVVWRLWMNRFPEGIPSNNWLLNYSGIRFRPSWWRWIFEERLGRLILGSWGISLFFAGLIRMLQKRYVLIILWSFGVLAYLSIFAAGNVQHDYYQILIIPVVSSILGLGVDFLIKFPLKVNKHLILIMIFSVTTLFLGFSWFSVRDYYKINKPEIVEAGIKTDELVPEEAKVIAPYEGDTTFLYYTKRQGWPAITYDVKRLIANGAEYYVAVNYDKTTENLLKYCDLIYRDRDNRFVLISLKNCREGDL